MLNRERLQASVPQSVPCIARKVTTMTPLLIQRSQASQRRNYQAENKTKAARGRRGEAPRKSCLGSSGPPDYPGRYTVTPFLEHGLEKGRSGQGGLGSATSSGVHTTTSICGKAPAARWRAADQSENPGRPPGGRRRADRRRFSSGLPFSYDPNSTMASHACQRCRAGRSGAGRHRHRPRWNTGSGCAEADC